MKVQQQGEVRIEKIDALPNDLTPYQQKTEKGSYIISHSETGNHHVIDGDGVTVMERKLPPEFGEGMAVLYAIVERPPEMYIDAPNHHESAPMEPGIYELIISTETDPFTKQARRVAD